MFYVQLTKPLAGARSTVFVFETEDEKEAFLNALIERAPRVETEDGTVGTPQEIFPDWGTKYQHIPQDATKPEWLYPAV